MQKMEASMSISNYYMYMPCIRMAWILNWPIRIQKAGKTVLSCPQFTWHCCGATFLSGDCRKWKACKKTIFVSKFNLPPKMGCPCPATYSFWTKYADPQQIKPTVLGLSIRRGQRNSRIVFIFVSCKVKDYYHFFLVGQFSLDCCSYCRGSHPMQGGDFSLITLNTPIHTN